MGRTTKSVQPWNDWYHVMCHTYGTWLPGDPRGFRTRHHREHIEGDYKSPPPKDKYKKRHERAKQDMKREPVYLSRAQRRRAVQYIGWSLERNKINVVVVSVDRVHLHLLAKFPDRNPRRWVGIAKKESSAYMKQEQLAPPGGIWAVRCKCKPVTDREHQLKVTRYLHKHIESGAAIWRYDRDRTC